MKLLKDDSDASAGFAQRRTLEMGEVTAIDQDTARIRLLNAADASKKRTLAGSAETDDAVNGARLHMKVDFRKSLDPMVTMPITLADTFERDHRPESFRNRRTRHAQKDGDTAPL